MRIRRRPRPPSPTPDPAAINPNGTQQQEAHSALHPDGDLLQHDQQLKQLEMEMEMEMDPNWRGVNSNKSSSSGTGALISSSIAEEEEKSGALEKSIEEEGYDNGAGVEESDKKPPPPRPVGKERKAKAKANANTVTNEEEKMGGSGGRKRRSPAVLMEGSRCSRVNGRGWRCCQQTLVGYSLCEHHLGKGRLRSVSSVRGQLGTSKPVDGDGIAKEELRRPPQMQHSLNDDKDDDDDDEKTMKKKRKKIGLVKARSISSLLDETDHSMTTTVLNPVPAAAAVEPPDVMKALV